jgi:hypothetical protein
VIVRDATTPKAGIPVGNLVMFNKTITKLILKNLDGVMDWVSFGEALAMNKVNSIQVAYRRGLLTGVAGVGFV